MGGGSVFVVGVEGPMKKGSLVGVLVGSVVVPGVLVGGRANADNEAYGIATEGVSDYGCGGGNDGGAGNCTCTGGTKSCSLAIPLANCCKDLPDAVPNVQGFVDGSRQPRVGLPLRIQPGPIHEWPTCGTQEFIDPDLSSYNLDQGADDSAVFDNDGYSTGTPPGATTLPTVYR